MREVPKGGGGDPVGGASGDYAWGNDLQAVETGDGLYENQAHNVLRSGPIEVGSGEVHLQFRRWLTVEDGMWDHAYIEVNGTRIWTNLSGPSEEDSANHHIDEHWAFRSYDVTEFVDDGVIEVEWHLESDWAVAFGGWTIDDVRVVETDGGGPVPGDDDDDDDNDDDGGDDDGGEGRGCSCNANLAPASGSLGALLALLGAVSVRRRR